MLMRRRTTFLVLSFVSGALFQAAPAAQIRNPSPLRSFYIVRFFFSDDLSGWNHEVLDVATVGEDVRVRVIHMALANPHCDAVLVRAAERVFPRTTVEKVAGQNLCVHTEQSVQAALGAARRSAARTEAASQIVVAACGTEERVLTLPYDDVVDSKALRKSSPTVAALADAFYRVRERAVGKRFSFDEADANAAMRLNDVGTALVPELGSGKYDAAFRGWTCFDQTNKVCAPNYLAWRLKGYAGPPSTRLLPAKLLDEASLHLIKYVPAEFPPIAASARVVGDVHLKVAADPQTGFVTKVDVESGPPLLASAAVDAARSWRFAPAFLSGEPVDATLQFRLRCSED